MELLDPKKGDRRIKALRALERMIERLSERRDTHAQDRIRMLEHRQRILEEAAAAAGVGIWECELPLEHITWTRGVYDIFQLPPGMRITRDEALGFYTDQSRGILEEKRSRAIGEGTGFTLDTEIMTALGSSRWMRITATVEYKDDAPVRIFGIKRDITEERAAQP
jgi:PAS domain-containing protein